MADTRVVAARTYRAMERLTKARQAIIAHLQLEPLSAVRKSSDPNFDRMRELESTADFFERLAQKLGVEIPTEGETPTEPEGATETKSFEQVPSTSESQYTDDTRQSAPVVSPEVTTVEESGKPAKARPGRQTRAQKRSE